MNAARPLPDDPRLSNARVLAVAVVALASGAGVVALVLASDHQDAKIVWATFGPAVGWCFVGTGLYAWRRRPESRTGALMVLLGFAWFLFTLESANSPAIYTFALATGGLWGGVFLHLGMTFPSGRLASRLDRAIVIAGYLIFPLGLVPALPFAGPRDLGCEECPSNLLGADAARGSGLRGLTDRVAALDGTLSLESPAGGGTRLRAEIPYRSRGGAPRGLASVPSEGENGGRWLG